MSKGYKKNFDRPLLFLVRTWDQVPKTFPPTR